MTAGTARRAAPLYCPYCGEQDLRPDAADGAPLPHGGWRCGDCRRTYRLTGLAPTSTGPTENRPTREVTA